jgi:hypothetical protein
VVADLEAAAALADLRAPEHLELLVQRPLELAGAIRNAGAIFLGDSSPEPVGDYIAGPNHVLPTGGTARWASPLGTYDFLKRTSLIGYSAARLAADVPTSFVSPRRRGCTGMPRRCGCGWNPVDKCRWAGVAASPPSLRRTGVRLGRSSARALASDISPRAWMSGIRGSGFGRAPSDLTSNRSTLGPCLRGDDG